MNNTKLEWLEYAKTASNIESNFSIVDSTGQPFEIQWKRNDILSDDVAKFKKDLSDLAAEKLAKSELAFLKVYPEAVSQELFLGACKPLLNNGIENADWDAIQETIKTSVKQFYLADLSKFGSEVIKPLLSDVYFCVTATKLGEVEPEAFLLFSITPALPFGDVKVINFFTKEDNSCEYLKKLLMETIFKILPETKRLFLFVRPTDTAAFERYSALGFEKDESPFQDPIHKLNHEYQISLNYRIDNSKILL